jgi:hypothetical protein
MEPRHGRCHNTSAAAQLPGCGSLLIEVQVEQPQLLLPLLTSDNRIERFYLVAERVKTINRSAYAFGIVSRKLQLS